MATIPARKSLEETWRSLESEGEEMPRHPDGRPLVPERMPNFDDDEPLGYWFFRCGLEDADNSNLTLPRTFFGRSEFNRVSFANTDLSESRICWNNFSECDFSGADLSGCDMRASIFEGCKFTDAAMQRVDLRRSSFIGCDFTGAELTGAVVEQEKRDGGVIDQLGKEQRAVMEWHEAPGPEPPGG
jgi:BTB/POZ domain-containing protein KCTD9